MGPMDTSCNNDFAPVLMRSCTYSQHVRRVSDSCEMVTCAVSGFYIVYFINNLDLSVLPGPKGLGGLEIRLIHEVSPEATE